MALETEYIKGECMNMCPDEEILLREKERLLHVFEVLSGTESQNRPRADPNKVVKSFSRSAAGKQLQNPKNLRPPEVLLKTLYYLLTEVAENQKVPWHVTYNFIMDRLRSVRQDMIIQNVSMAKGICILQPIIRFYAYAAYRSCNEPVANFDSHINQTHLQECLKRLLCLYDECDKLFPNTCSNSYSLKQLEAVRPDFEALYLLLNLGSAIALIRALSLPKKLRDNGVIKLAMTLSLSHYSNNFVKLCRIVKDLPVLLQCVVAIHLPDIRRKALRAMSVAYNSKNLVFPLCVLKELLLYEDLEQARADCLYYGLQCNKLESVQFLSSDFNPTKLPVQPSHLSFIDECLAKIRLSDLLLSN